MPRPYGMPMEERPHNECHRTAARGVQAADQNPDGSALGRDRRDAVLGSARVRSDQHEEGRWLADTGQTYRSTYCARRLTQYLHPAWRPRSPIPTQNDPAPAVMGDAAGWWSGRRGGSL